VACICQYWLGLGGRTGVGLPLDSDGPVLGVVGEGKRVCGAVFGVLFVVRWAGAGSLVEEV
jgi:hypothetical protein